MHNKLDIDHFICSSINIEQKNLSIYRKIIAMPVSACALNLDSSFAICKTIDMQNIYAGIYE